MTALPISALTELRPAGGRFGSRPAALRLVAQGERADQVAGAVVAWQKRLLDAAAAAAPPELGGTADGVLDLSAAHPSGIAQLYAGRVTPLVNLIRDPGALPLARRRTRELLEHVADLGLRVGYAPVHLVVGVARWSLPISPGIVKDEAVAAGSDALTLVSPEPTAAESAPAEASAAGAAAPVPAIAEAENTAPDDAASATAEAEQSETASPDLPTSKDPGRVTNAGAGVRRAEATEPTKQYVTAPVLLRPIAIAVEPGTGATGEYELALESQTLIHPTLAAALSAADAGFDAGALAAQVDRREPGSPTRRFAFHPADVLDEIARVGRAALPDFELDRRVLVASVADPNRALAEDLPALLPAAAEHDVIAALAGNESAQALVGAPLAAFRPTIDPDPAADRGVGDLDPSQRAVLEAVAAGRHLFVDAPLGADATSTAAAIIAEAAVKRRSVLHVSGSKRASEALTSYLAGFDLDDVILDVPTAPDWRQTVALRLLTAMNGALVPFDAAAHTTRRTRLIAARQELGGYIASLHHKRQPWNVSAYDALQSLAYLTGVRPGPATNVRVSLPTTVTLTAQARTDLAADLEHAARLGAFTARTRNSPWYGAKLFTAEAAAGAMERVTHLLDVVLPCLAECRERLAQATGLPAPNTVGSFAAAVGLLAGVRSTLETFTPGVFEASLDELIFATAPRRARAEAGAELGQVARRRARKRAEGLVRPSVRVPDLHAALVEARAHKNAWTRRPGGPGWSATAWTDLSAALAGLVGGRLALWSALQEVDRQARTDLAALQPALGAASAFAGVRLVDLPIPVLTQRLAALRADAAGLAVLPTRHAVLGRLRTAGLGALVADLAAREVPELLVAQELELVWWGSVFEQIIASDPVLAGQTGVSVDAMGRRFRVLDRAHVAALSVPIRATVRGSAAAAFHGSMATQQLYTTLIEGRFDSVCTLREQFESLLRALRPVLAATPPLVGAVVGPQQRVDLLVLDGAQQLPIEAAIGAIARARQVVVIGDPRSASGTAINELAQVLPKITLAPRVSRRDPELTRLLARYGYADILRPAPMPRREPLLHYEVVAGTGAPDAETGAISSTKREVDRAVAMALEHAVTHPEESLAIIALTPTHAGRIRTALASAARSDPAVAAYFSPRRPEPVVVTDIASITGLSREAVLLSVGFGRTPHGRILHRFGPLAEPGGQAQLLAALGVARKRLSVLSCFGPGDLQADRMRAPGPRLLLDLLELAQQRAVVPVGDLSEPLARPAVLSEVDRLLVDLGDRLWRMGYLVETNFGPPDGDKLALAVGHPSLPEEMLVAVVTDDATYVREPSMRVRDRQWTERLEALGWVVTQVWSAVAFLDPAGEAQRVRRVVQRALDRRLAETPEGSSTT